MLSKRENREGNEAFDLDSLRDQIRGLQEDSIAFRRHARYTVEHPICVVVDRGENRLEITGVCRDLSQSGVGTLLAKSPPVGEIMWLIIDECDQIDGPIHAQCVRSRWLPSGNFDVGFVFLSPIDLTDFEGHSA